MIISIKISLLQVISSIVSISEPMTDLQNYKPLQSVSFDKDSKLKKSGDNLKAWKIQVELLLDLAGLKIYLSKDLSNLTENSKALIAGAVPSHEDAFSQEDIKLLKTKLQRDSNAIIMFLLSSIERTSSIVSKMKRHLLTFLKSC